MQTFFKDFIYLIEREHRGEVGEGEGGEGEADTPLSGESDLGLDLRTLRS